MLSGRNPGDQAGLKVVNFGVTNLSATVKTDIANRCVKELFCHLSNENIVAFIEFYIKCIKTEKKQIC